jgi:hypothetical protein
MSKQGVNMLKFVTALSAALIIGWAIVGSASTASAGGYRHHGGYGHHGCCGPVAPKYYNHTVYKHKHIKRYRDVWRHKYVKRIKRIVHVTRIQPIIHLHKVTRVHTKIVGVVVPRHERHTRVLPAKTYVTSNTVYLKPVCACSHGGGGGYGGYGRY